MKKIKYILFLLLTFTQVGNLFSQGENLFNDAVVHEVHLTFDDANYWTTLTSNYDNNYPDVPYIMANATIDGVTVDSIGVRLKGFSSYWVDTDKKSIKLDFNEYVSGRKYDGLKKINLNNGEGDPAIQRDKLCYNMMRTADVNASRTAHTKVYLNGTYWGLYLLVEQIDKTFLKSNFGNKDGNLFKNIGNSALEWLGPDTTAYQEIFELKTGTKEGAWNRFVELVNVINNSSDTDFKTAIDSIFDVDLYLRVLAIDVATNNWDSYIEHGRNFYMYDNPESGKFEWIPWDYNLAIGGEFSSGGGGGGYATTFPIDMSGSEKVLIRRLLEVSEFQEMYYQHWCSLLDNNMTTSRLFPMIEIDGDLIRDAIYEDPNYVWTIEKFEADLDQGDNVIPGLKKFFTERTAALTTELQGLHDCETIVSDVDDFDDASENVNVYPNPATDLLNIAFAKAPEAGTVVQMYNSVGQLVLSKEVSRETMTLGISQLGAGFYVFTITNQKTKMFVNKKITIHK